jgi:hypothetical protein
MSEYFELALFSASNSVVDEHYERKRTRIFEDDPQLSRIEVRCKTLDEVGAYGISNTSPVVQDSTRVPQKRALGRDPMIYQGVVETRCSLCERLRKDTISVASGHACAIGSTNRLQEEYRDETENAEGRPLFWTVLTLDASKLPTFLKVGYTFEHSQIRTDSV